MAPPCLTQCDPTTAKNCAANGIWCAWPEVFLSHKHCRTVWTCSKCLGTDLMKTKMSSRYKSLKSNRPLGASCMNLWKALGALIKPSGMILNLNAPYLHANATQCFYSGAMYIWWYPHYNSRLLRTQYLFKWSSNSSIHCKGYLSNLVLAFRNLKFTHSRKLPYFLWANNMGCP